MPLLTKDTEWVRQSFLLPRHALNIEESRRRLLSDVSLKFTDTTLGGNFAINPPPQFTRYADVRRKGRFAPSKGMGRYYSEAIDDNGQYVHLRFGLPSFNSMSQFFGNFYDSQAAALGRTGRSESIFYNIGKAAGYVVSLPAAPFILLGAAIRFAVGVPTSKYYYLKPTMPLYWNAVNTIANGIATNMGILPRVHIPGTTRWDTTGQLSEADIRRFHELLPDVFRESGGIDIYAVANRAQRLSDKNRQILEKHFVEASSRDALRDRVRNFFNERVSDPGTTAGTNTEGQGVSGIDAALIRYSKTAAATPATGTAESTEDASSWQSLKDFADFSLAELRDGSQFVTFRVDYSGSVSESFSNSVKESDIAGTLNGMTSGVRSKRFSFADGNIGDGALTTAMEGITRAAGEFGQGVLDGLGIGGIAALAGRAFVDIPKHWDGSTANLPRMEYTIELRSPYGDKMSRFMNLYVPLAMLLAGALPLSAGRQSYQSPFLCEAYCSGRAQSRLAIVDSLNITRGVGNVGWNQDNEALGIDVSITLVDLSSIMHMPISAGLGFAKAVVNGLADAVAGDAGVTAVNALSRSSYDEDNAFTDYLAVLGSLTLTDQIYASNRLKLNLTRQLGEWKAWKSPSHFGNWAMGTWPARLVSAFADPTSRG